MATHQIKTTLNHRRAGEVNAATNDITFFTAFASPPYGVVDFFRFCVDITH